ncbi:MAG: UpxY family transcription antiterminator [Desulfobacteraceae bacterium]|nr:UpxY family transcription antiterminator [Desulfobacteraceae bacterium]
MIERISWFALLTRSNFEQTVYSSIIKKNIEAFLPKIKKKSRRKDRNLMIEIPLFPGYIFVKSGFEPAAQLNILKTTGAVRLLGNQSGPVPVPQAQVESLKIMTSANMDLITGTNIRLEKGDPVIIIEGPMAGATGEFTRYKGKGRVVIKIEALGQYAGVEVQENNIEKVPGLLA